MNISNRSLILLLVVTVGLVAGAAFLTISNIKPEPPPPPPPSPKVEGIVPEVLRSGGTRILAYGPLVVKLAQDVPEVRSAQLTCGLYKTERPVVAERNSERGFAFESVPFGTASGDCFFLLSGAEQPFGPVFPGDVLECTILEGRTMCTGSIAETKAGSVTVKSILPGNLQVDGEPAGPLPVEAMKMKVGERKIAVHLNDGRVMEWKLVIQPEEQIKLLFPNPDDLTTAGQVPAGTPAPGPEAPAPAPAPQ